MEPAHVLSISPVDPFWAGGLPAKRVMATLSLRQWCRLLILASFYGLSKLERAVRGIRNELPIKRGPLFDAGAEAAHQPIDHESVGERRQRMIEAMKKWEPSMQIAQAYLQSNLCRLRRLICNQIYADCAGLSAISRSKQRIDHVTETSNISDVSKIMRVI